ncbi:MAG: hypothetical protein ACRC3I_04485 [Cetobacterium sp.]
MNNTFIDEHISVVLFLFLLTICFLWILYKKSSSKKKYIYGGLLIFIIPLTLVSLLKNIVFYMPGSTIGSIDGWLSFLGGYTGALLALVGIWWQIKENNSKEMNAKINSENEALFSFFVLVSNYSDTIKEISEMYLKNYLDDESITTFDENLYNYDKDIFFQLVSKMDINFYRYAIKISNLFSLINLRKTKINNDEVFLESFFCEQLEIFCTLSKDIKDILNNFKELDNESILKKLKNIEIKINNIENNYRSYFEQVSKNYIKNKLITYNLY